MATLYSWSDNRDFGFRRSFLVREVPWTQRFSSSYSSAWTLLPTALLERWHRSRPIPLRISFQNGSVTLDVLEIRRHLKSSQISNSIGHRIIQVFLSWNSLSWPSWHVRYWNNMSQYVSSVFLYGNGMRPKAAQLTWCIYCFMPTYQYPFF